MSYSSVLGGAERILLDRARALPGPAALACPPGPLAEAARERSLAVVELRPRRAELRGSAGDRPVPRCGWPPRPPRCARRCAPSTPAAWSAGACAGCCRAPPPCRPCARRRRWFSRTTTCCPRAGVARAVRTAARRCVAVVALSDAIAADLRLERTTVIRPGVDLHRFAPSPLPEGEPRVLVLGALVGWKRPGLALEIAARVLAERARADLRLAGAPLDDAGHELMARLRRRADQPDLRGRVELGGRRATRRRRWPVPPACCTAPTASRSGWCWRRRWPAAGRWPPPPRPARWRSSTAAAARLYRPGDADAGRARAGGGDRPRRRAGRARPRAGRGAVRRRDSNRRFAELIASVRTVTAPVAINARAAVRGQIGGVERVARELAAPPAGAGPGPLPRDRPAARAGPQPPATPGSSWRCPRWHAGAG